MALMTALILLVALTVIGTTAATVAIMETRIAGNYKQAISGDLLIRQATRVAAIEFADATTGSQVLSASSPYDDTWTTTATLSVATTTTGAPISVDAIFTPVREYDLLLRDIYNRSDLFFDNDGSATVPTAASRGSVVYYGYPSESSVSTVTKFFTEATPGTTSGFPAMMVNVANPSSSAYRGRNSLVIRAPGPPIIAVAATDAYIQTGSQSLLDSTEGGTETGPPDADDSCGNMSFERSVWHNAPYGNGASESKYHGNADFDGGDYKGSLPSDYTSMIQGSAAFYKGLADVTLYADGDNIGSESNPLVIHVDGDGFGLANSRVAYGIMVGNAGDEIVIGNNAEVHGLIITEGSVRVIANAEIYGAIIALEGIEMNAQSKVLWDSCALQNALSNIPPMIWNQ